MIPSLRLFAVTGSKVVVNALRRGDSMKGGGREYILVV